MEQEWISIANCAPRGNIQQTQHQKKKKNITNPEFVQQRGGLGDVVQ